VNWRAQNHPVDKHDVQDHKHDWHLKRFDCANGTAVTNSTGLQQDDTRGEMAKRRSKRALQFGALPWRIGERGTREIMLLTSRETHRWIIPKGWPIKGRKPADVASQEAYEEAGLMGRIVSKRPLGNFHYEKRLAKKEILCEVRVFLFRVGRQLDHWPEEHARETRWFDATEAAELVEEGGLAEIIRRFAGSYVRFIAYDNRQRLAGQP
jgi:8-oxo-dGTP pyrophosphatase MutT (NUDIX family)